MTLIYNEHQGETRLFARSLYTEPYDAEVPYQVEIVAFMHFWINVKNEVRERGDGD